MNNYKQCVYYKQCLYMEDYTIYGMEQKLNKIEELNKLKVMKKKMGTLAFTYGCAGNGEQYDKIHEYIKNTYNPKIEQLEKEQETK